MSNTATRDDRNNYLLHEYRKGHDEALATLCAENEPLIKAVARVFSSMGFDEDDFFSEARLAFIETVRRIDPDRFPFGSYVFRAMKNRLLDLVKAKSAGETPTEDMVDDEFHDPTDDIINQMTIDKVLEGLPERERELIQARYYEELTQDETAENMGISRQRVQQIEARALDAMREALDG
jgi:RNA polymerase sigma factor (sigma-70 family)